MVPAVAGAGGRGAELSTVAKTALRSAIRPLDGELRSRPGQGREPKVAASPPGIARRSILASSRLPSLSVGAQNSRSPA